MKKLIKVLASAITQKSPKFRTRVYAAHIPITPQEYMEKSLIFAFMGAIVFTLFFLFIFVRTNLLLIIFFPVVFIALLFVFIMFRVYALQGHIIKRRKLIDSEILFATRYLLVKVESGVPMFNAISDVAQSSNIGGKFFREIITDVELGTPLEEALENAKENTPSEKFRKLLRNILSTIQSGTDVTRSMKNISKQITDDQFNEIKVYEKKLNSLSLFYLILAVVFPSLGMTMFLLIAGFFSLSVTSLHTFAFLFVLILLQFFFLSLFKQARPSIDL